VRFLLALLVPLALGIAVFKVLLSVHQGWVEQLTSWEPKDVSGVRHSILPVYSGLALARAGRPMTFNGLYLSSWFWSTYCGIHDQWIDIFTLLDTSSWVIISQLYLLTIMWCPEIPRKPPDKLLPTMLPAVSACYNVDEWTFTKLDEPCKAIELKKCGGCKITAHTNVYSQLITTYSAQQWQRTVSSMFTWDSDCFLLVLDTGSSHHVINDRSLFINDINPIQNVYLNGVGGRIQAVGHGSVNFRVTDDDGVPCDLILHDVLYVPDSPANLISPQKLTSGLPEENRFDAFAFTSGNVTVFGWDKGKHLWTIVHCKDVDIPMLPVNEGRTSALAFFCEPCQPVSYASTPEYLRSSRAVQLSEGATALRTNAKQAQPDGYWDDDRWVPSPMVWHNGQWVPLQSAPMPWEHNKIEDPSIFGRLDARITHGARDDDANDNENPPSDPSGAPVIQFDNAATEPDASAPPIPSTKSSPTLSQNEIDKLMDAMRRPLSPKDEDYLRIHHRLKHLSPLQIQHLAQKNILPKHFGDTSYIPPPCPACIFGRQKKRPWRNSAGRSSLRCYPARAGEQTHVDQMVSSHPGLIPQVTG